EQQNMCSHFEALAKLLRRPPVTLGGRGEARLSSLYDYSEPVRAAAQGAACPPPAALVGSDFRAVRAEFFGAPAHFRIDSYLKPFDAACFLKPRLLEVPREPCPRPQGELVKCARKLNAAGHLYLATPSEEPKSQRMNLLAVAKNEPVDRIVGDRRRRNWLEAHLSGGARDLPARYHFVDHELEDSEVAEIFADDLRDFHPSAVALPARACTNAFAIELSPLELAGARALRRFGAAPPPKLIPRALSLVMGDTSETDWATEAHSQVLYSAGALLAERRVLQDKALTEAFDAASVAYQDAGLVRHPAKAGRGDRQGINLGAEVLGEEGHVGSERLRRMRLAELSVQLATQRRVTGSLLRAVARSWVYIPFVSQVFELPAGVRRELVLLAALCAAMTSNIRAHPGGVLVATDASESALGGVAAPISRRLRRELWRLRGRRGWPTHLVGQHGEWLFARGPGRDRADFAEALRAEQQRVQAADPQRVLVECFDVMELCAS
ncbi:unnamed protein product, partial [Prorocentrum cordatum]